MAMKILLDTNAVIALSNENAGIIESVNTADEIFISIINELEFKSFSKLSLHDIELFYAFVSQITVLDLLGSDTKLKNKVIDIRNAYKLKLPDSIIVTSAIVNNATLITADKAFKKVSNLQLKIY